MAKQKIDVDLARLEELAALQCTPAEIAAALGVPVDVMARYLDPACRDPEIRDAFQRGRAKGRIALRELMWAAARGEGTPAVSMMVHLGKAVLVDDGKPPRPAEATPLDEEFQAAFRNARKTDNVPLKRRGPDGREVDASTVRAPRKRPPRPSQPPRIDGLD